MSPLLVTLLGRMLVGAAVVVTASLAVERVGPFFGAMIATLPLSAGPAYVFLALDHDPAFLADSAVGSLLSVTATAAFLFAHAKAAPRVGTALSLVAAFGAWAATLILTGLRPWSIGEALALTFGANGIAAVLTRAERRRRVQATAPPRLWHVAVRAVAVMSLIVAVTLVGRALGPHAAGLTALLPIVFTSLIVILQPRIGGAAIASVMANGVLGMTGYGFALGLLNVTAVPFGSTVALLGALAACFAWNGILIVLRRRSSAT